MAISSSSDVTESSATVSKPLVSKMSSNSCDTPDKFWMRISSSSSSGSSVSLVEALSSGSSVISGSSSTVSLASSASLAFSA